MAEKKRRILKTIKWILFSFLGLCAAVAVFLFSYLMGIEDWKEFDPKSVDKMEYSTRVYDADGNEYIRLFNKEDRTAVSLQEISENVRNAFLAIEDARFYEHGGVDFIRICGALVEDIRHGGIVQGASTISQQLIKLTTLTPKQNVSRKLTEMMMAFKLERVYSKDEILELYLNCVYFGRGAYGIESAARAYFGISAGELTLSQGALLAAVLKSPSAYAPHLHPEAALARRNLVLSQMVEQGFLSEETGKIAKTESIKIVEKTDAGAYPYGYYTDMALTEATRVLGISMSELLSGGYNIETTLDAKTQETLETAAAKDELFPENAADGLRVECAAVALDPKTGGIKGILGGRSHSARLSFNRATSMRRQPGSAIKPVLVYAPAVEYLGYQTTDFLLDEQTMFTDYTPRNSGGKYRGWVSLRDCVAYSINIPAVKLLSELTVPRAKAYASSVGISFDKKDYNLSLALGGFTNGVSPLTLCAAYQPFADGGNYQTTYCIAKITDRKGNVLYEKKTETYHVLSEETAFLMNSMLSSCVSYGTAARLALEGVPLCAKTGTSTYDDAVNNKDAWIVAYNPETILCCWMGFDKTDAQHSLPKGATGGTYPAMFAREVFGALYEKKIAPTFSPPKNIVLVEIDEKQLKESYEATLATASTQQAVPEYYVRGTEPKTTTSNSWPPDDLSVIRAEDGTPVVTFTAQKGMYYDLFRIDEKDNKTALATFSGNAGKVVYSDKKAPEEGTYRYRITPYFPEGTTGLEIAPAFVEADCPEVKTQKATAEGEMTP